MSVAVRGPLLGYLRLGRGPAIVLLHGTPGSWYEWHRVIPALPSDATVIVPNLCREYGRAGFASTSDVTVRRQAGGVVESLGQLATGPAVLVGHGVGARVAEAVARLDPERALALVLAAPRLSERTATSRARSRPPEGCVSAGALARGRSRGRADESLVSAGAGHSHAPAARYQGPRFERDRLRPDESLPHPTAILWGEHDPAFPPAWSETLEQHFGRLEHVRIVRGAGAGLPLAAPADIAAAVLFHLRGRVGGT